MEKLTRTKQIITGISFIAFPVLFIIGNTLHSNVISFELTNSAESWMREIRHNINQQTGNLLEFLSAPFLIIMTFSFMNTINKKGPSFGIIGGIMALLGCIVMVGSKGAFCLSVAGFDTLPEKEFQQLLPAFKALYQKSGMLKVTWGLALLPLGFVIQSIGLIKGSYIPKWQALLILSGSLLLANPGFEIINLLASVLLFLGLLLPGIQLINGKITYQVKSF